MPELFIFSQDDELLTIITEDTGLVDTHYRIEVNNVPDTPFSFTVEADSENAKFVKEENKAVYRDHEGDLRLVVIRELDDSDSMEGPLTTATCEPEFMELAETFVLDRRFTERTAQFALDVALENTGWIGEVEVELGLASTNFYRLRVIDAVFDIINTWGGEFKDVVEFDEENNIIARKMKIKQRLGSDIGQRFEIDHNITEIGRTVLSYPVTAMYGWGASLETDGGGHTRYIDFGDVEWKKGVNGAPVDKPKGQKWVGDPEAFEKYKRFRGDKWIHRYGEFSNQDYEDPEELLWATWQNLQENKQPEVNYRLSVDLFDDEVSLGDTAIAIDRYFSRPIEIQARIVAMEYDLMDIDGTMVVEMGQLLNLDDDRINDLERDVEKLKNQRPSNRVTEDSYPDIKPPIPPNPEAIGGFEVIQLRWDYLGELYIKHYEVYGSQVADFVPDSQHLLWRGNVSAFGHKVNTDEQWYYYIRAVNYHGTASDFTERISASTVRILTDDIVFGEEMAERLRELSETSQIIADGTIDLEHFDNSIVEGNRFRGDLIALDGTSYIAEGVIGAAAIGHLAVDRFHLNYGIIDDVHIDNMSGEKIIAKTITVDKLDVDELSAISANLGEVVTGRIQTLEMAGINNPIIYFGSRNNPDGWINFADDALRFQRDRWSYYRINRGGESGDEGVLTGKFLHQMYGAGRAIFNFGVSPNGNTMFTSNTGMIKFSYANQEIQFRNNADSAYQNIRTQNINANNIEAFAIYGKYNASGRMINDFNNGNVSINALDGSLYLGYENTTSVITGVNLQAREVYLSGGILHSTSGNLVLRNNQSNSIIYLQANYEVRATGPFASGYIPMKADSFPAMSSERYKSDIKNFEGSGLELLRQSVFYDYIRKATGKRELGLVIERETPEIFLHDEESVNGYTHRTINSLAIKELDKIIQELVLILEDELNWLKTENQHLKNEIEILKEKVA